MLEAPVHEQLMSVKLLCGIEETIHETVGPWHDFMVNFQWVDLRENLQETSGNHVFSHEIWDFPVIFPVKTNQLKLRCSAVRIYELLGGHHLWGLPP